MNGKKDQFHKGSGQIHDQILRGVHIYIQALSNREAPHRETRKSLLFDHQKLILSLFQKKKREEANSLEGVNTYIYIYI